MGTTHARSGASPLTVSIALALGIAAAQTSAAGPAEAQPARSGASILRQQLRALMPAKPKARSVPASVMAVTSCADDSGAGTLRSIVDAAGDGDTVDLSALTCSSITLTQGAIPVLLNDLTIVGPGASALAIDGAGSSRVLVHPGYGTLTLREVTVRGGATSVSGYHITGGGCIASAGYVSLDHAQVRDCYASGEGVYGGGIFAYALTMYTSTLAGAIALGKNANTGTAAFGGGAYVSFVRLVDSTVSGNRAAHDLNDGQFSYDTGGGLSSNLGGSIRSSTIEGNYSFGFGGGLSTFGGVIDIVNSTVSGNRAKTRKGGGLALTVFAAGSISNSTISANTAASGGGVYMRGSPPQLVLQSTLIAGNSATASATGDIDVSEATTLTGANNLVVAAGAAVTLPADTLRTSPLLLPLATNGGPTRTHALAPGSPAIDAGNNTAALVSDQRGVGFPRVLGPAPDIGAFEGVVVPAPPVPAPAASTGVLAMLAGLLAWLGARSCRSRPGAAIFTHLSPGYGHSSQT